MFITITSVVGNKSVVYTNSNEIHQYGSLTGRLVDDKWYVCYLTNNVRIYRMDRFSETHMELRLIPRSIYEKGVVVWEDAIILQPIHDKTIHYQLLKGNKHDVLDIYSKEYEGKIRIYPKTDHDNQKWLITVHDEPPYLLDKTRVAPIYTHVDTMSGVDGFASFLHSPNNNTVIKRKSQESEKNNP